METCEKVLIRTKTNRKEWSSKEITEQRKKAKNAMNMSRTRKQRIDVSTKVPGAEYREVKRDYMRDKRMYVKS